MLEGTGVSILQAIFVSCHLGRAMLSSKALCNVRNALVPTFVQQGNYSALEMWLVNGVLYFVLINYI